MIKLYNNEYETVPSLLGNNIVDLIAQASELGMEYVYIQDEYGNEFWEKILFKKDGLHLKLIKQNIIASKASQPRRPKADPVDGAIPAPAPNFDFDAPVIIDPVHLDYNACMNLLRTVFYLK